MHELRIATGIYGMVIEEMDRHGLHRIDAVTVRVGRLSGIDPSALQFAWKASVPQTRLYNVTLDIEMVAIAAVCRACRSEFIIDNMVFRCRSCGSSHIDIVRGQEINIASLSIHETNSE